MPYLIASDAPAQRVRGKCCHLALQHERAHLCQCRRPCAKGLRSNHPGDRYCHVAVETPVKLTEHQRKLLKELDESFKKGGHKHSPNDKGWFEKAKDFFS